MTGCETPVLLPPGHEGALTITILMLVTVSVGSLASRVGRVAAQSGCVTAASGGSWQNTAFAAQAGRFTAEFDATPSVSPINAVIGLSQGAQTAYAGFGCLARFNPSGDIDARNGGAYAADSVIPYTGGVTYHFRLAVDVPRNQYVGRFVSRGHDRYGRAGADGDKGCRRR